MTTAARAMDGWRTRRESSVVLPLPRKPVISVTGMRPASGSRSSLTGALSDRQLQHVEPAGEAIDGVDDAVLVDVDVVELDGAGR